MKTTTMLAAFALPLLAPSLSAQTPDHLVGFTRISNLRHVDNWACARIDQCAVPLPGVAVMPRWAGGTGWDPARSGAWITDGVTLAKVDDHCELQCGPMPIPGLGPNAVATGLEVVESLNQLLIIDSLGFLHTFTNTCPPVSLGICNTGLGSTGTVLTYTSGLAVDEGHGIIFIAHCDFATGANFIAISLLTAPCNILCRVPVPPCTTVFGTIRGLAVNWGRRLLYATDGTNSIAIQYARSAIGCVHWLAVNCCTMPIITLDPMVGLAVRPGQETSRRRPPLSTGPPASQALPASTPEALARAAISG
mgnify:CR=1 FL=1